MSTRDEIRERWRRILHQQQASGRSASAFCREHGLSLPRLYKWRRKLSRQVTFSEVKLKAVAATTSQQTGMPDAGGIELRLPGRQCLIVRPGFDRQTLIDLLAVLDTSGEATQVRS